ncbi:ABC transporter substrate-binding protein [Caenimonas soli]|uniref:ABC transporter substrate-binding protein n=1 Tax=Caenimonas soli TaxID=2735555 RepID=UPI001556C661|nr:ABC transporter substrate-binding protein [Caenimonas soli]NPC59053.1 ABC transporter substrate-binding protein [Caenimonas soli]
MNRLSLAAAALAAAALTTPLHAQQGVSKTEVVIGTATDLSGPIAAWGKDYANGARLRVVEINEQGGIHGRKLKLLIEDNGYDPKKTVLATQKLVNQEKIFAMLGLMGSAAAIAAMPVIVDKGVISFMPMSNAREMFDPPHKLKFGFTTPNYDGMMNSTPRVYQATKSAKACALLQDDEFGHEVLKGAEAGLKGINAEIHEKTTYKRGATDFSSQVLRLRQASCDFIVLGTQLRETVGSIAEMRKLGYNPTLMGSSSAYTELIPRIGGRAMDGLYADMFALIPYMDDASQPVRFWANKYKTQFGNDPTVFAAYGYMTVDRFAAGLQKAGAHLTADSFVKAMESIAIPPDIFGSPKLTFSPTRHIGSRASRISQLQDGRWKVVYDYAADAR